jgi:hypothetical protein
MNPSLQLLSRFIALQKTAQHLEYASKQSIDNLI